MSARFKPGDVTAIIVNYNTPALALDAASSALGAGAARAIIVDNASTDGSLEMFASVEQGKGVPDWIVPPAPLKDAPPVFAKTLAPRLTVIASPDNRGFAAGCNQGLAYWQTRAPTRLGLLLNPDALVAHRALEAFCARLDDPQAGLCGASVVGFDAPHRLQAAGGAHLTSVFHRGRNIAEGLSLDAAPDVAAVEADLSYPLGAAIAFRADYLDTAGFLDERYFLYYEEADWTLSGAPKFRPVWARDAVIYHRYGAASGSERRQAGEPSARSALSDFHMARSRLLFAEKWRPLTSGANKAAAAAQAAMRLMRGRPDNARAVWRALSA